MTNSFRSALLLLIILPNLGFSQTVSEVPDSKDRATTPSLSDQLIQGVQKSQANNEAYYQNALKDSSLEPGAVIQPSADSAITATPDGPAKGTSLNLTDSEKKLSEEYIHDGMALRKQKELCDELDDPKACQGQEPDSKFLGMDSSMVQALSKAYTMVVGSMGGGIVMRDKSAAKDGAESTEGSGQTTPENSETGSTESASNDSSNATDSKEGGDDVKEEKTRKDYCKYIATGVEGVAFFQQNISAQNANMPPSEETAQKEVLYKAARSHKDRAKTHKLQFVGWGATTACYTAMMATGGSFSSWSNWLKLGGSALMTAFFKKQADINEGYYDKVKAIADQMPGKGDCNPVTEKDCYCAQEETMNDPNICLPQYHARKVDYGNYRVACIDASGQTDPKCTCIDSDACLDKRFRNNVKGFGLGTSFNNAVYKPLNDLARGQLTAASLHSANTGTLAAYNKKELQKIAGNIPSAGSLSQSQQEAVKSMNELGLPPRLAAVMAKQKFSNAAKSNLSKFQGGFLGGKSRPYVSTIGSNRNKVLNFSGGSGLNRKSGSSKAGSNQFSSFMNKYKKKGGTKKSGKVINYQNKAFKQAQISQDTGRPIFEIISRRYKVSGYRLLEVNR